MATKMSRTLITLTATEMRWLKQESRLRGTSMASLVREAIVEYRMQANSAVRRNPLENTAGIWKDRNIEGLRYVESLREEWDR